MRTLAPPAGRGWEYLTGTGWDWDARARRAARAARREDAGAQRRGRHVRPGHRPVQPVADHPRVDRPRHRARPRARLRGGLRRHLVRHLRPARHAALRLAGHERHRRPHRRARPGHHRLRRRGRGRPVLGPRPRRHPGRLPARPADRQALRLRALQRLRVRRLPLARPGAADGQRLAAAGRGRPVHRGADRRRRATASTSSATSPGRSTCSATTSSSPASGSTGSRNGRLAGQLRDVAYQATTTDFWGSMEAVGGPQTYVLGGAFNCGKAQPGQVAAVSHGCPSALFRGVNILNTTQEAGRHESFAPPRTTSSSAPWRCRGRTAASSSPTRQSSANLRWAGNTLTTNGVTRGRTAHRRRHRRRRAGHRLRRGVRGPR